MRLMSGANKKKNLYKDATMGGAPPLPHLTVSRDGADRTRLNLIG